MKKITDFSQYQNEPKGLSDDLKIKKSSELSVPSDDIIKHMIDNNNYGKY